MRKSLIAVIIGLVIAAILLTSCSSSDMKEADQAVYTYIKASVEGDDDLYKTVVVKEAQTSLEPHYHAFPGLAKEMNNHYTIKRFSHQLTQNKLYYYIDYYHPKNKQTYAYNLLMVKDSSGKWKSTTLTGISSSKMKKSIKGYEKQGVLVHTYKERKKDEK